MSNFVFVQDRESGVWKFAGTTGRTQIGGTKHRPKYADNSNIYPKPESVNCFIKAHKIIQAITKEEAWQILNSK